MSNCCSMDCELISENSLNAEVLCDQDINVDIDNVVVASKTYRGLDTEDISVNVDNDNYTISATLVPFDWLHYETSDWVQVSNYYTLTIPYTTHKCLNAYVEEMMLKVGDDYENVLRPTYKRLANDNILIRSDSPVEFKILIKGER